MEKNLNEIEVYSVTAFKNFDMVNNYVTLDKSSAISTIPKFSHAVTE